MRYAEVDLVGEVVEGTGAELVSNGGSRLYAAL
jgi:hypothetical protein